MSIESFEDIESWKMARKLTNLIYAHAHSNRSDFARDYGLRDQIRRASTSILSNIAEGFMTYLQHSDLRGRKYRQTSPVKSRSTRR
jgi:four helix bundle protein